MTVKTLGLRLHRTIVTALAVFGMVLMTATTPAAANDGASPDAAADFLRDFGDTAIAVLADSNLTSEQKRDEMKQLLSKGFEVAAISRFVLGKHWRRATDQERAEYRELFESFIIAVYSRRLESYAGENLEVGEARSAGKKGIVAVSSRISSPDSSPVQVEWRMRRSDEGWRILDIVVEGVSMAITQRSEFDTVIRNSGGSIQGLLSKLRQMTRA